MSADEVPFRVYLLDAEGQPNCLASCDGDSLGFTLLTLREEGQIGEGSEVGILFREPGEPGVWLVNPWPATPFGRAQSLRASLLASVPEPAYRFDSADDNYGGF